MWGSQALETAIGLVLLFTVVSLIATTIRETAEAFLQMRAVNLERGIRELLDDPKGTGLAKDLYNHALVTSLFRGIYDPEKIKDPGKGGRWGMMRRGTNLPAYIPARNVALALIDLAGKRTDGHAAPLSVEGIREGLKELPDGRLRSAMLVALDDAGNDIAKVRTNLEKWFDSGMDRVSGWYRKQTQWLLFAIGLVLAVVLNIDTLRVANALYTEDARRSVVMAQVQPLLAANQAQGEGAAPSLTCPSDNPAKPDQPDLGCAKLLETLPVPIGWSRTQTFTWSSLPGWIATALAISLGAPFWFDLLNKMMVIRSTVKPHEKSKEEASQDRQ